MRFTVVVVASLAVALATSSCRRAPTAAGPESAGAATVADTPPRPAAAGVPVDSARAADEHLLSGRFADAAAALRGAPREGPDPWRQVDLAFALAMAGSPDDAIRVAEAALPAAGPEVAAALHFDLALAYHQRGDPGRAATELDRADALRPDPRLREARHFLTRGLAGERAPLAPAAELARRSLPSAPLRGDEDLDWRLVQHQAAATTPRGRRVDLFVFTACEELASWCQTAVVAVRQPARDVADVLGRAVVEHEGHPGSLAAATEPATWRLRTALRRGVRPRWRESHVDLSTGAPTLVPGGAGAGGTSGGSRAARSP